MDVAPPAIAALLQGLDTSQQEAVTTPAAPLGILAGAGSGKTTVLTRRIAHRVATGNADAAHVLAVTFTRRAAAELRTRLWRLGIHDRVVAGTFHAVAWAAVRQRALDAGRPAPTLVADRAGLVGSLVEGLRGRGGRPPSVAEVVGEIEWAKARGIDPGHYPDAAVAHDRHPAAGHAVVAAGFAAYESARRRARSLDFDDLLAVCTDALQNDRRFGAAQRWRLRHLFVDEFQDVSPRQFALLEAWRDGRDDVCLVGDPHQAIYAWNGAEPALLRDLPTHLPGATVVRLRANYRSTPQVLAAAEAVLAGPPGALAGSRAGATSRRRRAAIAPSASATAPGAGHGGALGAAPGFEPAERAGADGPVPDIRAYPDEQAEAAGIARVLGAARIPGGRWSQAAVLVRTHAQLRPIERALTAAGIPHRALGRRLGEHPVVRAVLAPLGPGERARPGGLADLADDLAARLAEAGVAAGPGGVAAGPGGLGAPPTDTDRAALGAEPLDEVDRAALEDLLALIHEDLAADRRAPVAALLHALGAERAGPGRGGDGVDLATFHAAKGLEWATVVVAGVEDGFVPLRRARGPARDEEARLLYVALTRARHRLVLTRAEARHHRGDLVARAPSPWLAAIDAACAALRQPADAAVVKALQAAGRAHLDGTGNRTDAVAPLRAWRARAARAASVTEAAVCGDDVLAAIAARQPADLDELAAVPGFGRVLARRHGEAILAALARS